MEDEVVQLVKEDKNLAVPLVLLTEIPRATHEINELVAKSFSVLDKKLRVNFVVNRKINVSPPNLFELSSKAAHQSQGPFTSASSSSNSRTLSQVYSDLLVPSSFDHTNQARSCLENV